LHQDETCGALRSAGVGGQWEIAHVLDTNVVDTAPHKPLFLYALLFWGLLDLAFLSFNSINLIQCGLALYNILFPLSIPSFQIKRPSRRGE
jgi:hypothetical protein